MGSQEPSARISPKYKQTDGGDAARLLAIGGLILDPWQADILDDWMAITPSGRWVSPTCGGSVPRQNGKTGLLQGRIAEALTGGFADVTMAVFDSSEEQFRYSCFEKYFGNKDVGAESNR